MTNSGFGFTNTEFDGIQGLGWPALGDMGRPTYQTLMAEKQCNGTFAFLLRKHSSTKPHLMHFGGYDPSVFSGAVRWIALTRRSYWAVTLGPTSVGVRTVAADPRCILDTGTSLILTSTRVANSIHALLGATRSDFGMYTVPCAKVARLPTITVRPGGFAYTLTPAQYILRFDDVCYSGFSGIDFRNEEGLNTWILGDVFLRVYYSIYDFDKGRVGLARALQ